MKRRTLAILLAAIGVAAIVLGVLSATAWRASNVVAMSTPERPAAPVLVTDPGVLDLMPGDVEITATADAEQPVTLVIARTEEVAAWVGASPHTKVTGAADWETLAVEDVPLGEGGTETVPAVSDVDGWPVERAEDGTVTTTWVDEPGRWSVLAVTDGTESAPALELSWQREVSTPWLWPGVILGALLLIAGLALLVRDEQKRRRRAARQKELGERSSRRAHADGDATSVMPVVDDGAAPTTGRGTGTLPAPPVRPRPGTTTAGPADADTSATGPSHADPSATGPSAEARSAAGDPPPMSRMSRRARRQEEGR